MTDETKRSLTEIIEALPVTERAQLSEQYAKWYNLLIRLYKRNFGIDGDDDCQRDFHDKEQVVTFFRDAMLWWYRHKPALSEKMSPLELLKTRTCLGQIKSLEARLKDTGIPMKALRLNENFDKPESK